MPFVLGREVKFWRYNTREVNSALQLTFSVLGALIAITVPLIIAALHRKQLRQIELHRADPTTPLKPPPGPLWKWIVKYNGVLVSLLPLASLGIILTENTPITRWTIINVAVNVGLSAFLASLSMNMLIANRIHERLGYSWDILGEIVACINTSSSQEYELAKAVEAVVNLIHKEQSDKQTEPPR
jgi:hypothetical protein